MLAKIGYYCFVLPLSHLPLVLLYIFTDFFYLLIITVAPYRKKVIEANLKRSFPDKSDKELKRIKRKFYRHFTDLLAEGIKNLSISEKSIKRRMTVQNPELMDGLYASGKNVLLVSGHYNNWEWLVLSQPLLFKHAALGIGMPMTSKFWDEKINQRRSRFGMKVIHAKNYKQELTDTTDKPKAVLVLSDQSPGDSKKSYWMDFLNQPTAILFGAEIMAHQLNYAVVYFTTHKIKRGRYELRLQLITDDPQTMQWGEITETHTKKLEQEIIQCPEFWLWSHKRWKREIPEDLKQLKQEQREFFNQKFNK
ncbi:MAG: lysophospholipid acyltransferase family protein [Crocinitomicaceae bacterium]|nr:lysophospholipid acyltransferase family protein [Crocinitomicaceae bacterium]